MFNATRQLAKAQPDVGESVGCAHGRHRRWLCLQRSSPSARVVDRDEGSFSVNQRFHNKLLKAMKSCTESLERKFMDELVKVSKEIDKQQDASGNSHHAWKTRSKLSMLRFPIWKLRERQLKSKAAEKTTPQNDARPGRRCAGRGHA